ncbi:ATP synthase subunit delta [Pirellulimonas nuda]|uniref:ATP synthase subunit delta n=1 Tax=Pirellulimonas nuda TaxID=2528009 RepID=A0A518DAW6_9BACT|nr:ATP synthase F1 subunit delta [Pirellulimonas nuda]QDU88625.1 ATP synthase subunit delta [Pirellulimonas nuda]
MAIDPNAVPKHETVMDVTAEQIARTYAEAFLGAVAGDPQRGEWVEQLEAIERDAIRPHPEFAEAIRSAFVSQEDRIAMLERVFGGRVGEPVLNLLRVMSRHNRAELIGAASRHVRKIYDEEQGRRRVEISVAHQLSPELQEEIVGGVRSRFGFEPVVSVTVDPSLVAGIVLRVGDTVYDGSVSNAFRKAHQAIVQHVIQRIEDNPMHFLSEAASNH